MPHKLIWVEKVLDSRSAVLTPAEAYQFIKRSKENASQPAPTCAEYTIPSAVPLTKTLDQEREDILEFRRLNSVKYERMEDLVLQAELQTIEKSKLAFDKAISGNNLRFDGVRYVPYLRMTPEMRRMIEAGKKAAEKSRVECIWKRVHGSTGGQINRDAVITLLNEDSEEEMEADIENEADTAIDEILKISENTVKTEVVSDDEAVCVDSVRTTPIDAPLFTEPSEELLGIAASYRSFSAACQDYTSALNAHKVPLVFSFEGYSHNKPPHIVATPVSVLNDIDVIQSTNVQFEDAAVREALDICDDETEEQLEQKFREHFFGSYINGLPKECYLPPTPVKRTSPTPSKMEDVKRYKYNELDVILSDTFQRELAETTPSRAGNIRKLFGFKQIEEESSDEEDEGRHPLWRALESLFTAEEVDTFEYRRKISDYDAEYDRQKRRVAHQPVIVTVKPNTIADLAEDDSKRLRQLMNGQMLKTVHKKIKRALPHKEPPPATDHPKVEGHATVLHEYLHGSLGLKASTKKTATERKALQMLVSHKLSFLEKYNIICCEPDTEPNCRLMLDSMGMRFSAQEMEALVSACESLFNPSANAW